MVRQVLRAVLSISRLNRFLAEGAREAGGMVYFSFGHSHDPPFETHFLALFTDFPFRSSLRDVSLAPTLGVERDFLVSVANVATRNQLTTIYT